MTTNPKRQRGYVNEFTSLTRRACAVLLPSHVLLCWPQRRQPSLAGFLLLLWLPIAGGCGSSSDTVSVEGKVSYRGQPVTNASITFFPPNGRPVAAALSEAGEYEIDLPPGEYQVTISTGLALPPGWKEGDPVPPPKIVLPPQITTQAKTRLSASITHEGPASVDFALE
jgi:hypothetical protein